MLAAGPSVVTGRNLEKVAVELGDEPVVLISLDDAGAEIVEQRTAALAALEPPQNALAIAVKARVLSAPTVAEAIPGGELQVSVGQAGREEAEQLARDLELAVTLPVDLA